MKNKDWNKAIDGVITVPDELDSLVNKVGMQFKFVQHSGKNEGQAICDIVYGCQEFFRDLYQKKDKCIDCGKNHAEMCGSCVSDIVQGTVEQAISSR